MKNSFHSGQGQEPCGQRDFLCRILETSPVGIVVFSLDGKITYANAHAKRILGLTCGQLKQNFFNSPEWRITDWQGAPFPKEELPFQRVIATGCPVLDASLAIEWTDGPRIMLSVNASPLLNESGILNGVIAAIEDVTARQQKAEELLQTQKMEAVSQLARAVAHDFNNILAALRMHFNLLQTMPELASGAREIVKEIDRGTLIAVDFARHLLLSSRREKIQPGPLDLNKLINSLLQAVRRLGENIGIVFNASSNPAWVQADVVMLEHVIINLCINARDSMGGGGRLTLKTQDVFFDAESKKAAPGARPGHFICFSVTDTGCGMDTAVLKRIFEPFFTTKMSGKGMGLGLAAVHRIVKQHEGWIEVKSAPGKGSTFRIYLPACAPVGETAASLSKEITGGSETILVVEDETSLRRMVVLCLRKLGYAVLEATDGIDALTIWKKHCAQIQLLLTDSVMPGGISGFDLANRLRKEKESLKIIITSGSKSNTMTLPCEKMTYLSKPYDLATLAGAVRSSMEQAQDKKNQF